MYLDADYRVLCIAALNFTTEEDGVPFLDSGSYPSPISGFYFYLYANRIGWKVLFLVYDDYVYLFIPFFPNNRVEVIQKKRKANMKVRVK